MRVAHVGDVRLALDCEVVNLGVEGALDLPGRAAEADGHAVAGDLRDGKSVAGEPVGDGLDVGLGGTELLADLVGREPLVVVGRVLVVLAGYVGVEGGLLRGIATEHQDKVGHGKAVGDLALVVPGVGVRIGVTAKGGELGFVNAGADADGGRDSLSQAQSGEEECTG